MASGNGIATKPDLVQAISAEFKKAESLQERIERLSRECMLGVDEDVSEPPTVLEIKTEFGYTPVFTAGNLSFVFGPAKTKKTFLITLFAAVLCGMAHPLLRGKTFGEKNTVFLFDTEQSRYHANRTKNRIFRLNPLARSRLKCMALRKCTFHERLLIIEHELKKDPTILVVFIDGCKDLIADINNPEKSTELVETLMRLTEEYGVHICTALHVNKGNQNPRGHVGSEMTNKCETGLRTEKDTHRPGCSLVTAEVTRDKSFDPFSFSIDAEGLPYIVEDYTPVIPVRVSPSQPSLSDWVEKVFGEKSRFKNKDLKAKLIEVSGRKESWADKTIKAMKDAGLIEKDLVGNYSVKGVKGVKQGVITEDTV